MNNALSIISASLLLLAVVSSPIDRQSSASINLKPVTRVAFPNDVEGEWLLEKIAGNPGYDCPSVIDHTTYKPITAGSPTLRIVHNTIIQDGERCESNVDGKSLILYESNSYNFGADFLPTGSEDPLPADMIKYLKNSGWNRGIISGLNNQRTEAGDIENYYVGYERELRECGNKSVFRQGSTAFIIRPFNPFNLKQVQLDMVVGKRYLIMVPLYKATACVYSNELPFYTPAPSITPEPEMPEEEEEEEEEEQAQSTPTTDDGEDDEEGESTPPVVAPIDPVPPVTISPDAVPEVSSPPVASVEPPVPSMDVAQPSTDATAPSMESSPEVSIPGDTVIPSPTATVPSDIIPVPGGETDDSDDAEGTSSVEPEQSPEDDGSVCFPASATVQLSNGQEKRMDELKSGDHVQSGNGQYTRVFGFSHNDSKRRYSFVSIALASGLHMKVTPSHVVYVNGGVSSASDVKLNDVMESGNGDLQTVVSIGKELDVGLYNPQTENGDIVVNGIKVTTFTKDVEMQFAHAALTPFRAVYKSLGVDSLAYVLDSGLRSLVTIVPKA